ncbi:hypothetical protein HNQ06_000991 [Borrelia lanei]|uniref:Uncharacterized protein n=1 Tax=Borreliella lanei TaxID=373540 RepID=A0A7W9ZBN2_9SPIR|nr:hypothetical protein [Borreliella lanei]
MFISIIKQNNTNLILAIKMGSYFLDSFLKTLKNLKT